MGIQKENLSQTPHAADHIKDGTDEIDGDQLDVDFTPSNYTPDTAPAEASDLDHLTAHLKGIDTALAAGGSSVKTGMPGLIQEDLLFLMDVSDRNTYPETGGSTATDLVGNLSGTMTSVTHVDGFFDFNGTTSGIEYPNSSPMEDLWAGGGTVTGWLYMRSDGENNFGYVAATFANATDTDGWAIFTEQHSGNDINLSFYLQTTGADGWWRVDAQINTLYFFSVTYDSDSLGTAPVIKLNNVSQTVTTHQSPSGSWSSDVGNHFTIGDRGPPSSDASLDGQIGFIAAHGRSLSDAELTQMFESTAPRFRGTASADGDILDITWDPSNYTPTTSPTEVTSVDHLTAHLAGIDAQFSTVTSSIPKAGVEGLIQEDLVFLMDVGDRNTYPESGGSTNKDLVGDLTGTMTDVILTDGMFVFNGSTSGIEYPTSTPMTDLWSGGGTYFGWIEVTGAGENNGGYVGNTMASTSDNEGWVCYTTNLSGNNVDLRLFLKTTGADGDWSVTIEKDTVYFFAITYDTDNLSTPPIFYINETTPTVSNPAAPTGSYGSDTGNHFTIGDTGSPSLSRSYDGKIGLIGASTRALSAAELSRIYNTTAPRFRGTASADGDVLDISWDPTNYTPTTSPTEVTDLDHLTAHLAGIDAQFAALGNLAAAVEEGIITEDLVFAVDAHNYTSYDGTNTDLVDAVSKVSGTMTNVTTTSGNHYYDGTAMTQWATIPTGAADLFNNTGGGTVMALVRIGTPTGLDYFLDTTNGLTDRGWQFGVLTALASGIELELRIEAGSSRFLRSTYSSCPQNKWVVVTAQWDQNNPGTAPKLWVNNAQMEVDTWTAPSTFTTDATHPLTIGSEGNGASDFVGDVNAVLMYKGALSREEIYQNVQVLLSRTDVPAVVVPTPGLPQDSLLLDFDYTNPTCYDTSKVNPVVRNLVKGGRDGQLATNQSSVSIDEGYLAFAGAAGLGHIHVDKKDDTVFDNLVDNGVGMTVAVWVYLESAGEGGNGRIISTDSGTGPDGWVFLVNASGSASDYINARWLVYRGSTHADFEVLNGIKKNTWQHLVVTYLLDESPTIYVNGVAQTLTTTTLGSGTFNTDTNSPLYIADTPLAASMSDGRFGMTQIWDRKLSAAEVTKVYHATRTSFQDLATLDQVTTLGLGSVAEGMPTHGLKFAVDPKDSRSYVNGTTVLRDLVGGEPGTIDGVTIGQHFAYDGGDGIEWEVIPSNAANIWNGVNGGTVILWVYIDSAGGSPHLIDVNGTQTGWQIYIDQHYNSDRSRIRFRKGWTSADHQDASEEAVVPWDQWVQIAITYTASGSNVSQMYVNGGAVEMHYVVQGSGTPETDDTEELSIGISNDSGAGLVGNMDAVFFYDREFTPAEIADCYVQMRRRFQLPEDEVPAGIPLDSLQYYTDFGAPACWDGSSTLFEDLSSHRRTGNLNFDYSYTNSHLTFPGGGAAHGYVGKTDTAIDDIFNGGNGGTVHAWVRAAGVGEFSRGRILLTQKTWDTNGWILMALVGSDSSHYDMRFQLQRATTRTEYYVDDAFTQNDWHLVTVVYDSSETGTVTEVPTIYIDAQQVTANETTIGSGAINSDVNDALYIGDQPTTAAMWDGNIEIVALYDKSQSAEEVSQFYFKTSDRFIGGAHAHRHIKDGADEIDGDQLDIDFTPDHYIPNAAGVPEAGDTDHLTAHLKGLDSLAGSHSSRHITSGDDQIDGDKLDIDWDPTTYVPALVGGVTDDLDNLTSHLKGIDDALTASSVPLTTKGDLYGYDTGTARIPVGTNDQVLIADSVQALGVKWGAVPGHGAAHTDGTDNMDGDHLDINYDPDHYTQDFSNPVSANIQHLAAHLNGIDNELNLGATKAWTGTHTWSSTAAVLSGGTFELRGSVEVTYDSARSRITRVPLSDMVPGVFDATLTATQNWQMSLGGWSNSRANRTLHVWLYLPDGAVITAVRVHTVFGSDADIKFYERTLNQDDEDVSIGQTQYSTTKSPASNDNEFTDFTGLSRTVKNRPDGSDICTDHYIEINTGSTGNSFFAVKAVYVTWDDPGPINY